MVERLASIIVNNHNYGRYLPAAIDSALAQDLGDIEVVVVDDGSVDDSPAVIAGYGERVRAVFKTNGGQGSAFNAGFAVAQGAVAGFLDADDVLLPHAARQAAAAMADPAVAQWHAPMALIDADGRPLGGTIPAVPLPSGALRARALAFGPWAYPMAPTSGNFWSRRYLSQVLPMPEATWRMGADEYLCALAPLYGRLASSPIPFAQYRVHGTNHYWRQRLALRDVEEDSANFERTAALLAEHARRLGLIAPSTRWLERDWRQQLRRLLLGRAGRPVRPSGPSALLTAALADQTRPARKAVLLPLLAVLPWLPAAMAEALGLRLLARR
jgi:glycosyltransferase involved in cell wall biosynthesis